MTESDVSQISARHGIGIECMGPVKLALLSFELKKYSAHQVEQKLMILIECLE